MNWKDHNAWERSWWGNCVNTIEEEFKQLIYAGKMGLQMRADGYIDLHGKSVVDIGGGPVSLLLKTINGKGTVIDPCTYPKWTRDRYKSAGINVLVCKAEDLPVAPKADEVWIYNVLQHVDDPFRVVANARKIAPVVRVTEFIGTLAYTGHPHKFTAENLNLYFGGVGVVDDSNTPPFCNSIWSGVFLEKL